MPEIVSDETRQRIKRRAFSEVLDFIKQSKPKKVKEIKNYCESRIKDLEEFEKDFYS